MPIYEYVCKKCHHKFEKIQRLSDAKIKKCPECGGPVQQALTAPAVHFKGTGWYVTDYAKKPEGKSEGKDASGSDGKEKAPGANEKPDAAAKETSTKSSGDDQKSKRPQGKKKD